MKYHSTNMNQNYGQCNFCGANNVKSPRTGKIFCADKCWLKNKPNEYGAYPSKQGQQPKQEPNWDKIRDEKRTDIWHAVAFKEAVNIALHLSSKGSITDEMIVSKIKELFAELKEININGEPTYEQVRQMD